jgi:DNA-binding CsgD family transcriptional regulator
MPIGVPDARARARAAIQGVPDRRRQPAPHPGPVKVTYVFGGARPLPSYLVSCTPPRATPQHSGRRAWELLDLAHDDAIRGEEPACRGRAAEALTISAGPETPALHAYAEATLGLLELGLGNIEAAAEELGCCAHLASTLESGSSVPLTTFEADHVEALLALGRAADAYQAAERQQEHARQSRSAASLAAATRCRGLLADDSAFAAHLEAALALHSLTPGTFEHARTELSYGQRLRRARQRADSRQHLSAALALFERLAATPWASRAYHELEATSMAPRARHDTSTRDQLTPQELRVSRLIANGATVRETAAQLYLSTKTIEAHLTRAYRKLDVRNRAQLVAALDAFRHEYDG